MNIFVEIEHKLTFQHHEFFFTSVIKRASLESAVAVSYDLRQITDEYDKKRNQ